MKTIHSKRNPLTNSERAKYYEELDDLKNLRYGIKFWFKKASYSRVYTEPQAGGKCRMKLYGVKKKLMKKIVKHYQGNWIFSVEKHVEKRWHGSVYSLVLRVR